MTNTEHDIPAANRADSEIDFVLRRAKWRRGPEVLRDVARAQAWAEDEKPRPASASKVPRKPRKGV